MLEKTLGVPLVMKLREILLMEGDFNATNKIIYGVQMLNNGHQLMPEEIFSRQRDIMQNAILQYYEASTCTGGNSIS
jgi:hypothetical protein